MLDLCCLQPAAPGTHRSGSAGCVGRAMSTGGGAGAAAQRLLCPATAEGVEETPPPLGAHDDGPLVEGKLDGHCIVCPRHGARFNVKTGEQTMPAMSPVPTYQVRIEGNDILIAPSE